MTVESLTKSIENKKKAIEKLEAKMVRIEKAKSYNYEEHNPYYYSDYDYKWTKKDIEEAKNALDTLIAKLKVEEEKSNSRNITVILEFLENWKNKVFDYYVSSVDEWLKDRAEWYAADSEYINWWNRERRNATSEERIAKDMENRRKEREYKEKWSWLYEYAKYDKIDEEKLKKDLDVEANRKYDDIVNRTVKIAGKIVDACNLRVGEKGDLNGFIICENGKVKVETISAGGYNIQRFHFRTLVNKLK